MRNLGKTVCSTRLVYRGASDLIAETLRVELEGAPEDLLAVRGTSIMLLVTV